MAAATQNLIAEQQATFRQQFTVLQQGSTTPQDLTGATAAMMIRTSYSAPTPLISLTTANGGITLGGTAGTIIVYIPTVTLPVALPDSGGCSACMDVMQTAVPSQAYVYDLDVTYASGDVQRIIQGTFTVYAAVTHA